MSKKKEIRRKFREAVFKRDGYCCRLCGNGPFEENPEEYLDAHHITDRSEMPNGGYVKENGISLCKEAPGVVTPEGELLDESCHMKAEKYHISGGEDWEEGAHPSDLYDMIGSSQELAKLMSEKLK